MTCAGRAFPRPGAGAGRRTGPTCSRPGWPARSAPPWTSRAAWPRAWRASGGRKTQWRQALNWFISSYPLLGALAAAFKLVEDAEVCRLHGIRVAAISPAAAELYVNPLCGL